MILKDNIDLACPSEVRVNKNFACNITLSLPVILSTINVTVNYNESSNRAFELSLSNTNFSMINLKFAVAGYYQIIATEKYAFTFSAKMINCLNGW